MLREKNVVNDPSSGQDSHTHTQTHTHTHTARQTEGEKTFATLLQTHTKRQDENYSQGATWASVQTSLTSARGKVFYKEHSKKSRGEAAMSYEGTNLQLPWHKGRTGNFK